MLLSFACVRGGCRRPPPSQPSSSASPAHRSRAVGSVHSLRTSRIICHGAHCAPSPSRARAQRAVLPSSRPRGGPLSRGAARARGLRGAHLPVRVEWNAPVARARERHGASAASFDAASASRRRRRSVCRRVRLAPHSARDRHSYPSHTRGCVRHDAVHGTAARVTSQPPPCIAVSSTSKQCCDAIANAVGSDEDASLPACLCNRDAFVLTEQLLEDTFEMDLKGMLTACEEMHDVSVPYECEDVDLASKTTRVGGRRRRRRRVREDDTWVRERSRRNTGRA